MKPIKALVLLLALNWLSPAWCQEKIATPEKPAPRPIWGAMLSPDLKRQHRLADVRFQKGWEGSELGLARLLDFGLGTEPDPLRAIELYKMAVAKKSATAAQSLGVIYAIGNGVERDVDEAEKWFRTAAELGDYYPCMLRKKPELASDKKSVVALCALYTLARTLIRFPHEATMDGDSGIVELGINFKRLEMRVIRSTGGPTLEESAKSDLKRFMKVVPMPERLLEYDGEFSISIHFSRDLHATTRLGRPQE